MSDQDKDTDQHPTEELIKAPDWEARENASDDADEWTMTPVAPVASTSTEMTVQEAGANAEASDGKSVAVNSSETADADHIDMARYDLEDDDHDNAARTDHDAQGAGAADVEHVEESQDGKAPSDAIADESQVEDHGADAGADTGDDASNNDDSEASADDQSHEAAADTASDVSEIVEEVEILAPLDAIWEERATVTIDRWGNVSERYTGKEAFKTALVLPLLSALGYDTFNPDQVEPLEDESGQHDGYLAKGPHGEMVVLLEDADVADDHRDKIAMRARRDRLVVGARIPSDDGEGSKWQSIIEVRFEDGAMVAGLRHVHRDAFSQTAIIGLAHQMQGEQEHILNAIKKVIGAPGSGFVQDVRVVLEAEGHTDTSMLAERISLIATKMLSGPEAEEVDVDDDDKTRQITSAEQTAFEQIREMCGPEIAPERIVARPAQNYLAVLLDDNNRRTIARLHFSAARSKYIGLFKGREENRNAIQGADEVTSFKDEIRSRLRELDPDSFPEGKPDSED